MTRRAHGPGLGGRSAVRARLAGVTLAVVLSAFAAPRPLAAQRITVRPGSAYPTLSSALAAATPGATITITAGTYREPPVVVRVPRLTIVGEGWPVLDGEGAHEILTIRADDVTVRGLTFRNTGVAQMEDRAALRVTQSTHCLVVDNRFRDALFAIYLENSVDCEVRGNDIRAAGLEETRNGNGIHLWYSPRTRVIDNRITGQRDGIYFEFSQNSVAIGNVSEGNRRYGLHFMFSDSCRYERNTFRANGAGIAVMYSRSIVMDGNGFLDATGPGAYGLLLKEITDGVLVRNRFEGNTSGLYLEGAARIEIRDNVFRRNGWAVRLMASTEDSHFIGNEFSANAFDVSTNSRNLRSDFDGNWWDAYRGYDLDRDGTGDVPFQPVRLFALIVERHPESLMLLRSPVTAVLDAAERVFPVLTPELADPHPLMRPPR
jgi:nitrous oxidase accessory protein